MNRNLKIWLENLEKQMINLAKRQDCKANKNESGISETKAKIVQAESEIQTVSDEVIENTITMADFMEEYYLSQFE